MKSVGIDIGSSSIKIVEVQSTSKGVLVSQFIEHGLNIVPGSDQELDIIEFLRNFTSQYDPTQTRFVVALRQDRVAIRNKFFPFNDRIKISKSLAFELEEDLPFSSDNAIFDAKIIRTVGGGAEVLACAAPKNHVRDTLQRAQDSGMDPFIISTEGTALANAFERWNEPPPATTAPPISMNDNEVHTSRNLSLVINIGHVRTLVLAFERGSLIGVRSIPWGGKNVTEAIALKYEIPFLEALKEMQTKAFILTNKQGATFDQVTFSDTIAKSVREMARDLQMSILELKSEFNAQIETIGMTGGVSQIQNLGPFLTQILEAPVNRTSTLDLVPNVLFERSAATGAKAGVALGLAIEGLKKPRNPPINFLRGEFAKQNHEMKMFWEKWAHTAKILAAAVLCLFIYSSLRSSFSVSLADRTSEALKDQAKAVANLRGKNATESGIRKYIRENKKRGADLKLLSNVANMNSALDVMKKISDATPAKNAITLDLQQLKITDAQVTMQGYVNSPRELSVLQQALANVAEGQVKADNATLAPRTGRTSFSFSFNVDRGIQKVTR